MSLLQLFGDIVDPPEQWVRTCAHRTNNALTDCQRQLMTNPQVDLYPVEGGVELKVDLPGMNKENVKITVEQNTLTLTGERKNESEREESKYHYAERYFGQFTRRLRLPFNAHPNLVKAKFENGVLTVTVPQPESTKAGNIIIE